MLFSPAGWREAEPSCRPAFARCPALRALERQPEWIEDQVCLVSGSGNVAQYTVEKLLETAQGTVKELEAALEDLIKKENDEREQAKKSAKPLFDESMLDRIEDELSRSMIGDIPAAVHPMHFHPVDSIPRFAWGKYFQEGDTLRMPLSVPS